VPGKPAQNRKDAVTASTNERKVIMVHDEMHVEAIPLQFCRTLAEIIRRILSEQQQLVGERAGKEG
jgi:hypothetical protein